MTLHERTSSFSGRRWGGLGPCFPPHALCSKGSKKGSSFFPRFLRRLNPSGGSRKSSRDCLFLKRGRRLSPKEGLSKRPRRVWYRVLHRCPEDILTNREKNRSSLAGIFCRILEKDQSSRSAKSKRGGACYRAKHGFRRGRGVSLQDVCWNPVSEGPVS